MLVRFEAKKVFALPVMKLDLNHDDKVLWQVCCQRNMQAEIL